ncbi:hypothetical protein U1Q18_003550, partial [Sarracenia purpurea var. burkii]
GHGKEATHESPCPSPSYAKVVSSGLAGGHRFVDGKIFQTGLRIGSSLEGTGCSGDKVDRDFMDRPVEDLKAIQNRRGKSKVTGCFRCAYLLAPLVYSFGWYILYARCLRVYAMCSYRDMALFDSAVLSPPISSVLLLWGCVSLHTAIAPLVYCFVRSLVGCAMLECPLSWWMAEMFFEFEAWRKFWIQKEGRCDFKTLLKSPVLLLFFTLGSYWLLSLGPVMPCSGSPGGVKAACFSWLWRRLWRWLSSLNFWDHKDHCYAMNALSG